MADAGVISPQDLDLIEDPDGALLLFTAEVGEPAAHLGDGLVA